MSKIYWNRVAFRRLSSAERDFVASRAVSNATFRAAFMAAWGREPATYDVEQALLDSGIEISRAQVRAAPAGKPHLNHLGLAWVNREEEGVRFEAFRGQGVYQAFDSDEITALDWGAIVRPPAPEPRSVETIQVQEPPLSLYVGGPRLSGASVDDGPFLASAQIAHAYTYAQHAGAGAEVAPVLLTLQNPVDLRDPITREDWLGAGGSAQNTPLTQAKANERLRPAGELAARIRAAGHDGYIFWDFDHGRPELAYVFFDPAQARPTIPQLGARASARRLLRAPMRRPNPSTSPESIQLRAIATTPRERTLAALRERVGDWPLGGECFAAKLARRWGIHVAPDGLVELERLASGHQALLQGMNVAVYLPTSAERAAQIKAGRPLGARELLHVRPGRMAAGLAELAAGADSTPETLRVSASIDDLNAVGLGRATLQPGASVAAVPPASPTQLAGILLRKAGVPAADRHLRGFARWFGAGVITDDYGDPLVLYQPSVASQDEVAQDGLKIEQGPYGPGVYLTARLSAFDPTPADIELGPSEEGGQYLAPVVTRLRNPLFIDDGKLPFDSPIWNSATSKIDAMPLLTEVLRATNYDGIVTRKDGAIDGVVVLDSADARNAIPYIALQAKKAAQEAEELEKLDRIVIEAEPAALLNDGFRGWFSDSVVRNEEPAVNLIRFVRGNVRSLDTESVRHLQVHATSRLRGLRHGEVTACRVDARNPLLIAELQDWSPPALLKAIRAASPSVLTDADAAYIEQSPDMAAAIRSTLWDLGFDALTYRQSDGGGNAYIPLSAKIVSLTQGARLRLAHQDEGIAFPLPVSDSELLEEATRRVAEAGASGALLSFAGEVPELQTVAALFGHRVVPFVHAGEGVRIDGFVLPEDDSRVFVNVASPSPLQAVLGHELAHQLRLDDEANYQSLLRVARQHCGDAALLDEEVLCDYLGSKLGDPNVFSALELEARGLGVAAASQLERLTKLAAESISPTLEGTALLNDCAELQAAALTALAQWQRARAHTQMPGPAPL